MQPHTQFDTLKYNLGLQKSIFLCKSPLHPSLPPPPLPTLIPQIMKNHVFQILRQVDYQESDFKNYWSYDHPFIYESHEFLLFNLR